jgi:hypothetical protein
VIHYVTNGNLKHGTTLCGLKVSASMGVIATKPSEIHYVTCPECRRRFFKLGLGIPQKLHR